VVLDVKPAKGQRILMQTAPCLIHSGTDFAINSAGILITETTIGNFVGFDPSGLPDPGLQGGPVQQEPDDFVKIMSEGNNGGTPTPAHRGHQGERDRQAGAGSAERDLPLQDGYYDGENYVDDSR
jgi:hypothetical protein